MIEFLKSLVSFLWCRDSDSAAWLAIDLAEYLDDYDLTSMADYFNSVRNNRKAFRRRQEESQSTSMTTQPDRSDLNLEDDCEDED